ncbi:ATP-binding protein [Naasia sp. SYSU D00057]|uniref:ATP-binding protein n=1 Tax=Naasia sp. SYSU D00057 TaxID=2817380 RepID=UPI001FEFA5AF|nr:ATP-binding protein [Naasia sp. SYSU D00057]
MPDAESAVDLTPLVERIAASGQPPVVLLDGGSGSGKSTLAAALAGLLSAQLVHLDDIYPGWDGLEEASRAVVDDVLGAGRWRRWDWAAAAPAEVHSLDRDRPLIVEGSGALSRRSRDRATFGIWVELAEAERKRRALARDGATYAPHWDRWAAQERAFRRRERPDLLADVVLDGRATTFR